MEKHKFRLEFFPWITVFLASLIYGIYIFVPLVEAPADFRESHGVKPGEYLTYITYGFIHANLKHLFWNTFFLLIFGSVVEQQVRRRYYISVIGIAIFVGAVCGIVFPYPTTPDTSERIVGFSAAGWALIVMGVCILIRHWNLGKVCFWVATILFGAFSLVECESIKYGRVTPEIGAWVVELFGLGICIIVYSWFRNRPPLHVSIPVLLMLIPLTGLLHAHGAHPGEVGHLTGALIGTLFLFPVLQNEAATDRTTWLIGVADIVQTAVRRIAIIVREKWGRRLFTAVLILLLIAVIYIYIQYQWG